MLISAPTVGAVNKHSSASLGTTLFAELTGILLAFFSWIALDGDSGPLKPYPSIFTLKTNLPLTLAPPLSH